MAVAPWIFQHGTNKVEGCLMVLFVGLVFSRCLPPLPPENFSADALVYTCRFNNQIPNGKFV